MAKKVEWEKARETAYADYAGIFVRGLPRDIASNRLVKVLPNPVLEAVIERSSTQVSRIKNEKAQLKEPDVQRLYNFYLKVSQMPVAGPDGKIYSDDQTVPYYTKRDVQQVIARVVSTMETMENRARGLRREMVTELRGIRDAAPESLPEISFDDAGHLLRDGVTIDGKEPTVIKEEKPAAEPEKASQEQLHPLEVFEAENHRGDPMISTDEQEWFHKPFYGLDGMATTMGYGDDEGQELFEALTMQERIFLEAMSLIRFYAVPKEDLKDRLAMTTSPKSFWKIYWKYSADDNEKLRNELGRFLVRDSKGKRFFDSLADIKTYERKLMRYYKEHQEEFAEAGHHFDHSAKAVGLVEN